MSLRIVSGLAPTCLASVSPYGSRVLIRAKSSLSVIDRGGHLGSRIWRYFAKRRDESRRTWKVRVYKGVWFNREAFRDSNCGDSIL